MFRNSGCCARLCINKQKLRLGTHTKEVIQCYTFELSDSPITPQLSSTTKAATETRHYCDMSGRITQYRENWGSPSSKKTVGGCKFSQRAAESYLAASFRLLTRQGPAARGGARDYKVNGVMTRGIAFVVYPAVYRTSGVMTFIINQDGRRLKRTLARTRPKWRRLSRNTTPTRPGRPPSKVQQPGVRCECRREVGIAGGPPAIWKLLITYCISADT